jgi:hypothetical protein
MGDLTVSGAPVGSGNSKIRRKQIEIMQIDVGIEQRLCEIQEKEEEVERMKAQRVKLVEEKAILEQQVIDAHKS